MRLTAAFRGSSRTSRCGAALRRGRVPESSLPTRKAAVMGTGYCGGLAMRRMSPTDPSWPTVYPAALFINIFGILQCLWLVVFYRSLGNVLTRMEYEFFTIRGIGNPDVISSILLGTVGLEVSSFASADPLGSASNLSLGSGSGFEMRIRILLQYINVSNESWNIPCWRSFRKSKILSEFYESVFFFGNFVFLFCEIFAVHLEFR
jgi:hypothetical protein